MKIKEFEGKKATKKRSTLQRVLLIMIYINMFLWKRRGENWHLFFQNSVEAKRGYELRDLAQGKAEA